MNEEKIYEISELSASLKALIETQPSLRGIRIRGEISGLSDNRHLYFSLKDGQSQIDCNLWSSRRARLSFRPRDGMKVIAYGSVEVYSVQTRLKFNVETMRPEGVGDIYRELERLKEKLRLEGLFDESRKKALPMRPRKIAVVTSAGGAVYHDIVKVTGARDPGVPIVLVDVPVQGMDAGPKIAEGIRTAGSLPLVDVIIVGRGGGSAEDLWCFHDETLVRAIAACPVPVISAVGHETDTTLCDYAADRRAATPSQAAEMAVPDIRQELNRLETLGNHMEMKVRETLRLNTLEIARMRAVIEKNRPESIIQQLDQRSKHLRDKMDRAIEVRLQQEKTVTEQLRARLLPAPDTLLGSMMPVPGQLAQRLMKAGDRALERKRLELLNLKTALRAVSPTRVLERGYAMVTDDSGIPVTDVRTAEKLARMDLRFADGQMTVTGVKE